MRSLTEDALSWYISQNPKKWVNWVSMASDIMDRFRFNIENTPYIFYIQNLKKKPPKTFREYATRWRSDAAKVRTTLEKEHMNKFFVSAQDPEHYERLMVIENHKFSNIIKLGERIEEEIKSGIMTNFEALQATNKALQSGGISKKKKVGAVLVDQGMKGHTIDKCCSLKDKIKALIDTKVIQVKEAAPNVRNNPLPDHRDKGAPIKVEVTAPTPFEVEVTTTFTVMVAPTPSYKFDAIPWDYVVEANKKGKAKMEETGATQGITRTGKVYMLEHLGGKSKEAVSKLPIIETGLDDLCRKVQVREYSVVDHLNKTPAQISILSLLHRNALMKVLSEAYVPTNITNGEMANMVGQEAVLDDEDMNCSAIVEKEKEEEEDLTIQTVEKGAVLKNWTVAPLRARRVPG
ncbi:uncharacterized protein [Nicotiana sylvestris]|uniref:uncharacterized protein n=1 Tax=Nicotiana sylvestris TaxID=4096 RepID=UPI00388CA8DF